MRSFEVGLQSRCNQPLCEEAISTPVRSRTPIAMVRSHAHFPLCYKRICDLTWIWTKTTSLKGKDSAIEIIRSLCSVWDSNSLPEFGRLACNHKHLLCISGAWGNRNLISCLQGKSNNHYTNVPCGLYQTRTDFPWSTVREDNPYPNRPLCVPIKSRTLTKGLEDPCAFHYTIRTLREMMVTLHRFLVNSQSFCYWTNFPFVAGKGPAPITSAYETDEILLSTQPAICWHWWTCTIITSVSEKYPAFRRNAIK